MLLPIIAFSIYIFSWCFMGFAYASTLKLQTPINCGDQAILTCTSTDCREYRFLKDGAVIYTRFGPQIGTDPARYSVTVTSGSQVQLTITKIQLSDAGMYKCSCGFEFSAEQKLQYICKATTSIATINPNKKLSISSDSLYPQPSSITTDLSTQTTQLLGIYTCVTSPTVAFHYMCTWFSIASLPDGNHSYVLKVTTETQVALVTGTFTTVTPDSPTISNLVIIANNRTALRGVQDSTLTVKCESKGGIPAPTLAWYRGSTSTSPMAKSSTSDAIQQEDGTYTVTLTYDFTPRRTDDLTGFLCRLFYPEATPGASPDPSPASALLYLELKPSQPIVSQSGEAVSGGNMTLRCTSTNGRPAPSITWFYQGQTFTPTNNQTLDPTSVTYIVVSELQRPVSAEDNGQKVTCRISHTTLSVPFTGVVNVTVKFGPSTGSTVIFGNRATPAMATNTITLNCTSGSSNPASDITWYNGSDVIPNTEGYRRWPGNHNGVISSNIMTITPTRYMDGDRITCRSDNSYGSDIIYVDLDILYPPLIQPLLNITSTEGEPDILLTCIASSKPPAKFTWRQKDKVLANGTGTTTYNSFTYTIPRVYRSDAGSYQCQAGNIIGSSDPKNMHLIVKYPPAVTVSTTFHPSYTVTCTAEGYPDNYTYQNWVQVWPGYGSVATIPFTGTTLNLTGATYEQSGVYVCGASNGVAVYGTNVTFMKGNATVLIKAPPVLTDPSPDGTLFPFGGRLGQDTTFEIKYWSNVDGSAVKCYKHLGDSRSSFSICSVTETDTEVTLSVHNHMVTETGRLATIKIHISNQEDMTTYDIVLLNNVQAEYVLVINIVPQGPPFTPTITNLSFDAGQVTLTVVPGFHGELNQTIVVQISIDKTMWHNSSSVNVGKDLGHATLTILNLQPNTLHFVRAYAFNSKGQSQNYSAVLNVAVQKDDCTVCSSMLSTVAVSVSTTAFITIILCAVVNVIVLRTCPNFRMWIFQPTCPIGNKSKCTALNTVKQSQSLKRSGRQLVYSTLVAAENSTGLDNLEAIPTYESLNQSRSQPVYTSLEEAAEQRNTYENLKKQ